MSGTGDDLLALLDGLVERAGPGEGIEALGLDEAETRVRVHGGAVESLSSARTRGVGVRVVTDGRTGYAWTADLGAEALTETLDAARAGARESTPDEGNVLPAGGALPDDLDLHDDALAATAPEDKVALALEGEAAALRGERITGVEMCQYGDSDRLTVLSSSAGPRGSYRRTDAFALVEALAADGGSTTSAHGLDLARSPHELDVIAAGAEAALRAARLLGGRKPTSGRMPVLLDPFAAASLLGVLAGALSAEAVQKGRSLFAERLGETVGGEHVSLVDDGRRTDAPAAAPWDDEGVPTGRSTLIDAGVLRGWLHNTATATRAGTVSTGNARRAGYTSPPGIAPSNVWLEPGGAAPDAVLAEAGDGFYCQQLMGLHSGANAVTGDLSVGVAGMMVRGGAFAEPVREATIAGTIPELLERLVVVGGDLRFLPFGGGLGGSTWLIESMTLSGS